MWYRIKARDMSMYKPDGKVIKFYLHADSKKELDEILKEKSEITDIEWIREEPNAFEE
tara:strand:+ start:278 stop:451 length:174 start_codon:yes stop_codon:yes gene_type:complete